MKLYDQSGPSTRSDLCNQYLFAIFSVGDLEQHYLNILEATEALRVEHDDLKFQRGFSILKSLYIPTTFTTNRRPEDRGK